MVCPHCRKEIPATAVRCRYCRRVIREEAKAVRPLRLRISVGPAASAVRAFFLKGKNGSACPWSYADVILITVLLWLFITGDPFHIGENVLKFLKLNFHAVTKDPRLLYYLTVYLNTMIFKAVAIVLVFILMKARKVDPVRAIFSLGSAPEIWWKTYLPLYAIACLVLRDINSLNPLIPNLPFDSVFPEARIAGNLAVIFSVLFVAPIVEETIFRGFLYPALNRYMGIHPAVIVTAALFTLAHYPQAGEDAFFALTIFALGIMITYARAVTGSTFLAILMHHIYNLIYVAAGIANYLILKY